MRLVRIYALSASISVLASTYLVAQPATAIDPRLYAGLSWRNAGPFRGGRVGAVTGAIGQPGTFYVGNPNGGVWKTTSAGQTWYPVFDGVTSVSSVGAVEVAPSDPNIVYVGTGDMLTGSGLPRLDGRRPIAVAKGTNAQRLYLITNSALLRSDDGGATWPLNSCAWAITHRTSFAREILESPGRKL